MGFWMLDGGWKIKPQRSQRTQRGEKRKRLNNAPFSRLIPLRQKTTAGHGPALPEQDRFANRIFFVKYLDSEVLRC